MMDESALVEGHRLIAEAVRLEKEAQALRAQARLVMAAPAKDRREDEAE